MRRRTFLRLAAGGAFAAALGACGKQGSWPEGMVEIKWDRDTCVRCNMVISDPRFAAQLRGGEKNTAFKFDDIGCLVFWLRDKAAQHAWMAEPATRMWVADSTDMRGATWLDAHRAHYLGGRLSPMGYNFAAVRDAVSGGLTFEAMREQVLAKGK
ncbi:MAG: nitrous oxide reductase accessory protein NosL [Rhodocyclaceae bacterium]|nr:nitrous oxide reductase accessory protein NosL [Rhodocyclaceae bacterium]